MELLGRNRLIAELLEAGIEVALPVRDRCVDLIAYIERGDGVEQFQARPIQKKAARAETFGLDKKYAKIPDLLIAYVWNLDDAVSAATYVLSYDEAFEVTKAMGYTKTESWARGSYVTTKPSKQLLKLLVPYRSTKARWRETLKAEVQSAS